MSTASSPAASRHRSGDTRTAAPDRLTILARETRAEILKTVRMPAFAIPTLAFPALFYTLFGIVFGGSTRGGVGPGGVDQATYLMATYGAFGVIGAALFGFGVGFAVERGQGWLLLKRVSPMPPVALFTAKTITACLFGLAIVVLIGTLGATFGGVSLTVGRWLLLTGVLMVGTLPFCALGLALGCSTKPNAAPAVVNLLYLPLAFASGLWIPIEFLPDLLQRMAPALPPYHLGQLALIALGAEPAGTAAGRSLGLVTLGHGLSLAAWTLAGLIAATWAWRRVRDRA